MAEMPGDEGEVQVGIGADHEHGVVVFTFPRAVAWFGMPPEMAIEVGQKIIEKGMELLETKGKPS